MLVAVINEFFSGRPLCIATMHQKESVIAPVLKKEFNVTCFVPHNINTDMLGTFSGEVERMDSPLQTARKKCELAYNLTGTDLLVANEGSFGPHPHLGFVPFDEEIMILYDKKNSFEITAKELSLQTNFSSGDFYHYQELCDFANKCLFPSHALIIKDALGNLLAKGVNDWDKLQYFFNEAKKLADFVKAETDMRAHMNPTRMGVIEKCAKKLVENIKSTCPNCNYPGFVPTETIPGLPCENCSMPTKSTLKYVYLCKSCKYTEEKKYPHSKRVEEAVYCDFCNP